MRFFTTFNAPGQSNNNNYNTANTHTRAYTQICASNAGVSAAATASAAGVVVAAFCSKRATFLVHSRRIYRTGVYLLSSPSSSSLSRRVCLSLTISFRCRRRSLCPRLPPLLSSPKRAQIVKKRKKDRKKYNKYQRSTVGKYKKKSRIILNLNETTVKLLYYFCYSVTLVW